MRIRRQIDDLVNPYIIKLNSKFKFLAHIVSSSPPSYDNKIIIVSYFTSTLDLVEKFLSKKNIKSTSLTGQHSPLVREQNIKAFLN